MSFFHIFRSKVNDSSGNDEPIIPWIPLNRLEQLEEITEISHQIPAVIFKYSTTCGVSRIALRNFEKGLTAEPDKIKLYFLDLHAYRAISNEISNRYRIIHESPQLIVIKNGVSVHHASHHFIDAQDVMEFITK